MNLFSFILELYRSKLCMIASYINERRWSRGRECDSRFSFTRMVLGLISSEGKYVEISIVFIVSDISVYDRARLLRSNVSKDAEINKLLCIHDTTHSVLIMHPANNGSRQ